MDEKSEVLQLRNEAAMAWRDVLTVKTQLALVKAQRDGLTTSLQTANKVKEKAEEDVRLMGETVAALSADLARAQAINDAHDATIARLDQGLEEHREREQDYLEREMECLVRERNLAAQIRGQQRLGGRLISVLGMRRRNQRA